MTQKGKKKKRGKYISMRPIKKQRVRSSNRGGGDVLPLSCFLPPSPSLCPSLFLPPPPPLPLPLSPPVTRLYLQLPLPLPIIDITYLTAYQKIRHNENFGVWETSESGNRAGISKDFEKKYRQKSQWRILILIGSLILLLAVTLLNYLIVNPLKLLFFASFLL